MKIRTLLSIIISVLFVTSAVNAGERERPMRRGHAHQRGNENSRPAPVNNVMIGNAVYGGNGCPQGTMQAVLSPDNLSFSLLFDKFIAEVSEATSGPRDVMTCDILIPMQVPEGMQMTITRVDLRGFSALPERARGMLHSVFNFRGKGGDGNRMNLRYAFSGPIMENYELSSDTLTGLDVETSPCGGDFKLRILNQLRVQSPRKREQASLTLDSIDGSSEATYFISYGTCSR